MSGKIVVNDDGAVRVLSINRPEVHNCIDGETAVAIHDAICAFAADDSSRVLIVTGSGQASFCSGADLKHTDTLWDHAAFATGSPLGFARLDPGKPTIAAINGYCFAGGFELAAWCDFRIAATNAEFGVLNRRWGIPLIDGGTQRLPRIVGSGNAQYLMQTGVWIDADRALQMGFVQELVETGTALKRATELAHSIASYPVASLLADRSAGHATFGLGLDDGLMQERTAGVATLNDPEMAPALARFATPQRTESPRG